MSINKLDTKKALQAYLLLYCANANYEITEEERLFIADRMGSNQLALLIEQFKTENDFQRLEKINESLDQFYPTQADREKLINEMQALFEADHKFDTLEHNTFLGLRRILRFNN